MLLARNAFALLCALLVVPFSISFADDEQTETLHNNTFQQGVTTSVCLSTSCYLYFSATQHVSTVVTALSCSFEIPSGGALLAARLSTKKLSTNPQNFAIFNLPVFLTGTYGGTQYFAINAQTQLFIEQGDSPQFFLITGGDAVMSNLVCTISGYHS